MKDVYDAAVIGCGRMGGTIDDEMGNYPRWRGPYSHGAGYAACPRTRIVAAADPVEEKRTRFGERYGVPANRLFADARDMLARVPLDIVSVATHAPQHCECVLAAVDAGAKAIFCEKPLASSLEEADKMVAAAEKHQLVTADGTLRRWSVTWNNIKDLIDSGEAGTALHIVQFSGGALLHTESHFFDLGRYLLGNAEPQWAVAHLLGEGAALGGADPDWAAGQPLDKNAHDNDPVPDCAGHGYIRFKSGTEYFLVGSGCLYHETTVVCTKAVFRCFNNGYSLRVWTKDPESKVGYTKESPIELAEPASSTLIAVNEIVKCLDEGGNTRCTFRDGLVALEMAMAFHESHRLGNVRVDWPLKNRSLKVLAR